MKLSGIIWLEEIVEKIERRHRVTQDEVREILRGPSHFRFVEKGHRRGENVYAALGELGSILNCVFCSSDNAGSFNCVSARDDRR